MFFKRIMYGSLGSLMNKGIRRTLNFGAPVASNFQEALFAKDKLLTISTN